MSTSQYEQYLERMFSLRRFGIKLGLELIADMLGKLGEPQNRFQSIHVAGTNGKGSVASALATILQKAGYKTGLYTSPHLVRFNERICIDNQPISDAEVVAAYQAVEAVRSGPREPTFFEYTTAMAFERFASQGVDWAVVETGMGGRLDATNVLNPALSIITNISVEHREYLGRTIARIAGEKAGIIKPQTPVVTGVSQKEARQAIQKRAEQVNAPYYRRGEAFRVRRKADGSFAYFGLDHAWQGMRIGLAGNYQVENAALVLAGCELLRRQGADLPEAAIREGLSQNRWPGRLELVEGAPRILLDGAHNRMAARNLARYLSATLGGKRIILVAGILDDKPYKAMLRDLAGACERVILTAPRIGRALAPETLAEVVRPLTQSTEVVHGVENALKHARNTADPSDIICVAGSLYVVGEAKEALEKQGIGAFSRQ